MLGYKEGKIKISDCVDINIYYTYYIYIMYKVYIIYIYYYT